MNEKFTVGDKVVKTSGIDAYRNIYVVYEQVDHYGEKYLSIMGHGENGGSISGYQKGFWGGPLKKI